VSNLVWSPVFKVLEQRICADDDIILILVPFAKLAALQQLHWVHSRNVKLKVVCRWRPEDILAGVSDVEVYSYLRDSGSQLFINSEIHLKLYVFASNTAFNTSGNMTLSGLGYSEKGNVEVGNLVVLTSHDWIKIYEIINSSRQVDDSLFEKFADLAAQRRPFDGTVPLLDILPSPKAFTISSLPAAAHPQHLLDFYLNPGEQRFGPEEVRRASHDFATFRVPNGLTGSEFEKRLGESFRKTRFVIEFVEFLKASKSLRFGAVNDWIHQKCEDVPLPYRWEIKENTRIFYDWLAYYVPEISWDTPRHSQVIYWQREPNS
jgi:hypothetical protein